MIAQMRSPVLIPRRRFLLVPLALLLHTEAQDATLVSSVERELIASVERDAGLLPPLTLGIARVVLRPGASAFAATPNGARMIVVESGVLAVSSTSHDAGPLTSVELGSSAPAPAEGDELFVPAGTTVTFGSLEVARVRNPGARSVVALDVAVFREEPRPISRAFTTEDGISFQLLASASAAVAPVGRIALALERLRVGPSSELPSDLCHGLTLSYVEAGAIELRPVAGEVFAARAAASTPYSVPGSLQVIAIDQKRGITAGGVIFMPVGAECAMVNVAERTVDLLAVDEPTYETTMINSPEGIAALQTYYDMYVRDGSVPTAALTNTQTENQDLFIAGEIAMMISHPSEYVAMQGRAADATGSDKERADQIVANMAYGLIPEGPVRRAVVFGGSNAHIMSDAAHGAPVNRDAARALVAMLTGPEWSLKNNWTDSNPANLVGFETKWMKQRLEEIAFLEVTTAMLPYGIPFPVVPESPEVMNIIVPEMLQNALTETMTVEEAANDAADRINALIASR